MKKWLLLLIGVFIYNTPGFAQENLFQANYTYFPGTSDPAPEWTLPEFDDALWLNGKGAIGYGDTIYDPWFDLIWPPSIAPAEGDTLLETVIEPVTCLYVRYPFSIDPEDTVGISGLSLEIFFDDGFIARLNGEEFARVNMGTRETPADHGTLTERSHESPKAAGDPYPVTGYFIDHDFLDQHLRMGDNVITVEVHNDSLNGSDLFLECALHACQRDTLYDPLRHFWSGENVDGSAPIRTRACVEIDSSDLPLILIESDEFGIPFSHEEVIACMKVIDNGPGNLNSILDTTYTYDGRIRVEVRGGSSKYFPKQSFNIETQLPDGSNNNVPLLGMPEENDWKLIGPISDRSLIRHTLTYELGRKQGAWQPRSRFCELVVNGEYLGLYALTEKIKPDDNRLDIASLDSTEITGDAMTGGYIFWKRTAASLQCYYPSESKIRPEQLNYITDFSARFWDMLFSDDFLDPEKGYHNWIDIESMLDYLVINELTFDHDKYSQSTFMYKDRNDRDSLIHFGPLWDYNYAYGNTDQTLPVNQWRFEGTSQLKRLFQDTSLVNRFAERWHEQRLGHLHTDSIFYLIDSLRDHIAAARRRDSAVWDAYTTVNVYFANDTVYRYDRVIANLKQWIAWRVAWIDENIDLIYYPLVIHNPDGLPAITDRGSISVYPNPFSDEIYIRLNSSCTGRIQFQLITLQGQLVDTYVLSDAESMTECSWNVKPGLPAGLYMLIIRQEGQPVRRIRLVKGEG